MNRKFLDLLKPFTGPARRTRIEWTDGDCPSCRIGSMQQGACSFCNHRAEDVIVADFAPVSSPQAPREAA